MRIFITDFFERKIKFEKYNEEVEVNMIFLIPKKFEAGLLLYFT